MRCKFNELSRFALAASALLAANAAQAQAQATIKVDGQWRAAIGAGFTNSTGNTRSSAVTLNGDVVRVREQDKIQLNGSALYSKNNGVTNGRQARGSGRYDYNLSPVTFAFGGLDGETDRIAGLDSRVSGSTGLGYKFINTPETTFNTVGGVVYTRDRYETERRVDGADRMRYNYWSALIGEESTHRLSDTVSAKQKLQVFPTIDRGGFFRAQFDAGLSVALTQKVSLNVAFNARHNSDPGPGIKKTDTLLTTGIGVKLE